MADRNKKRARKKNKKRGAMGLLVLELVGVAMFAMLLTFAQGQRATAGNASQGSNAGMPTGSVGTEAMGDWHSHDPRFTQVIGDLWEAGF